MVWCLERVEEGVEEARHCVLRPTFRPVCKLVRVFGGIGAMVEVFHRSGTLAVLYESNKTEWKTGQSSMAQSFSTLAGMPSGPGALPILHLASCGCTPS